MKAKTITMWVAIDRDTGFIHWLNLATTRAHAKVLYLEGIDKENHKQILETVRFARVTVAEVV